MEKEEEEAEKGGGGEGWRGRGGTRSKVRRWRVGGVGQGGKGTDFSPVVGAACGVRGRSGGRSIMMQRWRGCGTLELARALAIGRSANHSFGNNRLHTLHTKDTREPGKELPRTRAALARLPPTIPKAARLSRFATFPPRASHSAIENRFDDRD